MIAIDSTIVSTLQSIFLQRFWGLFQVIVVVVSSGSENRHNPPDQTGDAVLYVKWLTQEWLNDFAARFGKLGQVSCKTQSSPCLCFELRGCAFEGFVLPSGLARTSQPGFPSFRIALDSDPPVFHSSVAKRVQTNKARWRFCSQQSFSTALADGRFVLPFVVCAFTYQ